MCRLSAISPMATDTPPAPKSLHFLIRRVTSLAYGNSRCIFRSSTASPFCTSALRVLIEVSSCTLLDFQLAPPTPSLPVATSYHYHSIPWLVVLLCAPSLWALHPLHSPLPYAWLCILGRIVSATV